MTAQAPLKRGFNQLENIPGQIALDQGFHSDMGGIGTNLATLPKTPGVDELREMAGKPGSVDAPTLIQTVQTARARGSALMNPDDPAQVELGKAYLGAARAYENQFGRYLAGQSAVRCRSPSMGPASHWLGEEPAGSRSL